MPPLRLRDGGGLGSDADWANPREPDSFQALRMQWWARIMDWNLSERLWQHVRDTSRKPLLSDVEISLLRNDLSFFLEDQKCSSGISIACGQPIALDLLQGCLELSADVDIALPSQLAEGVRTGVLEPIPASGVWRPSADPECPPQDLLLWDKPWQSGLADPALLEELVEEDVQAGFADWIDGDEQTVREKFGTVCAAGKLGIVQKEGSAPRLIGDSSISNVNSMCQIQEKIELPGLDSLAAFVSRHADQEWLGFSLDFNKAHKRIKVLPSEQGLSVFAVKLKDGSTRWVYYHTAHFGCSWASCWWARLAGAFVRTGHRLLSHAHFLRVYVDDVLALFPRHVAAPMSCLLICLACALGFPLSWHKLDLGHSLRWIGWQLEFGLGPRATLPADKLAAMLEALEAIAAHPRRVPRKLLQQLVGRLVWFTSGARWLRPWLQIWFRALHKPGLHFVQLDILQLEELAATLDGHCCVTKCLRLSDVQVGWRLLEMGGRPVQGAADLSAPILKHGRTWLKFGEPEPSCIKLSKEELSCVFFFKAMLAAQEPIHLVKQADSGVVAAADAFGEGRRWGIGGWFLPAGTCLSPWNIHYFSIQLDVAALPAWFLNGKSEVQRSIAALEALAQLVLLDGQRRRLGSDSNLGWLSLRQACDNAGVVCATQKGLSMAQPLASVLQSMALYAGQHKINLRLSHVAGQRNGWADALSRGREKDRAFFAELDPQKQWQPDWESLLRLCEQIVAKATN